MKTITIRDEVYRRLLKVKRNDESFSELFERLMDNADPIETLRRLRGCVEFKEKKKLLSDLHAGRAERRL
ncbi:MAG: antitoxin VapB family protein [Candidatus Bathyarchaeia archaeon]